MRILDPACGSKMFWFDKSADGVVFGDVRRESHTLCDGRSLVIRPDVQLDYTALPFGNGVFDMVVFDPPHMDSLGSNSWMAKKYGRLTGDWRAAMAQGFAECFRVLSPNGSLIFKWCEFDVQVGEVVKLAGRDPLFGHKSGKRSNTHWLCFVNSVSHPEESERLPLDNW